MMTKFISTAALLALSLPALQITAHAQTTGQAGTLELNVTGIEAADGKMMIALFKGEDAYAAKRNPARAARLDVTAPTLTARFEDLEPGEYAITLYQDVNSDGELNRGAFGIPSEPYGFSNDAPVNFGPPSWSKARFTVSDETTEATITLR